MAIVNPRNAQRMIDKQGLVYGDKPSPWALVLEKSLNVQVPGPLTGAFMPALLRPLPNS